MSLLRDLQGEGEYVRSPSAIQSQSESCATPQPTAWGGKHLRGPPRYGRPDPFHSTQKRSRQGPGPLRPLRERHARERECHGIYPTSRRRKGRQSIGSPATSIPTSDTENAPLRSLLGTSTEESNLGLFSHLGTSDDAQGIQASKLQLPSAHSGHLCGSHDDPVKQGGPKVAFDEGLGGKGLGFEPRLSTAVEGAVVDGRKDAEDTPVQGVQADDDIVHDDGAVGRDSQPDMARESESGVNDEPLPNPTARMSQWLPIGLAASILCYFLVAGSWPASKLILACAVVVITAKMWAAGKGRKDRNKPAIAPRRGIDFEAQARSQ